MSDDVAVLGIKVESGQVDKAKRSLADLATQGAKTETAINGLATSSKNLEKESSIASSAVSRLAIGLGAIVSVGSLVRTIDEYTKFNAQLKLATRSQAEFNTAIGDVNRIATITQSSIASTATLYARLNNALRDLGGNQAQVAKITENVGLALKISGATATESASAILQLSQAFGSGVLRGEEFNAVNEAAPALMRALAESIGVPVGALREMATDGKLTADVLAKAFGDEALLAKFRVQAQEVGTISGAFQVLRNEITKAIGKLNEFTGLSSGIAKAFTGIASAIGLVDKLVSAKPATRAVDLKNIEYLSKKGALGAFPGREAERIKQLNALRTKLGVTGNQLGGLQAITGVSKLAPNFKSTVQAQNIDEIHRKQEAAEQKNQGVSRRFATDNKRAKERAEEETNRRVTASRLALQKQEYDAEVSKFNKLLTKSKQVETAKDKQRKEFANLDEKFNDVIQKSADKRYNDELRRVKNIEEEKRSEFEKTVDGIDQTFREGFASLINGGKGSWKSFTQSLFTTFKTTVADSIYKLFAQPFIVKIVASLLGATGAGGASNALAGGLQSLTGGASGGIGGVLSTVKSFFSGGNSSIIGGIQSLGAKLANGLGGIRDTIGGFLGQNAGLVANIGAFGGAALSLLKGDVKGAAFQGAGAGIGLALGGPIGGAIGSFLGGALGGLFGKKKQPPRTVSQLPEVADAFNQSLGGLLGGFGLDNKVTSSAKYSGRKGGSGYGFFDSVVNGESSSFSNRDKKKYGEESMKRFIDNVLGVQLVKAIQNSKLTVGIKDLFAGLADKAVIGSLIVATTSLNAQATQLNTSFGLTVDVAARVIKASGEAGQGLADFATKLAQIAQSTATVGDVLVKSRAEISDQLGKVYGDIVTEAVTSMVTRQVPIGRAAKPTNALSSMFGDAGGGLRSFSVFTEIPQQFKTVTEQVTTMVDRLVAKTIALPKSLDEFDALIKSVNTSTIGGQKQAAGLFKLRDAFGAYSEAIDGLKANVAGATFDLRDPATQKALKQTELESVFKKLGIAAPKSKAELLRLADTIDYTTKTGIDLAAVFQNLVSAFADTTAGLNDLVDSLRDENGFKTLFDFNFYKGLATNYGSEFANKFTDGAQVNYGASNNTSVGLNPTVNPSNNTTISTSDPNLLNAMTTLINTVNALQTRLVAIESNTSSTAQTLRNVTPNGDAIQTELAT